MPTRWTPRALALAAAGLLLALPEALAGAGTAAAAAPAPDPHAAHHAPPPPPASPGDGNESYSQPASAVDTAASREPHLAPAALDHYRTLAALPAGPRPASDGIDRRQFSLSAMSPGYLRILDVPPAYLDLPPEAISLAPFPANSSAQTRAELDHLLGLQARRTPQEVAASQRLAGVYYRLSVRPGDADWAGMRQNLFHMGRQLGAWFSPEGLPVTADFMARVWSDASYYLWAAKFRFNRVRPWQLEPRLESLENANFPAYPSGHSGNSWVAAYVYAELLPEHRELFQRNAADMAYSREILGVHFASDSESGRLFARQLVDRLLESPDFRRDLEAARREIRAAHSQVASCC
jgi:acid phosphatase (class A)